MTSLGLLAIGTIVCLTISCLYYATESRRHRIAATFLYRENRELRMNLHDVETDLAIWMDVLEADKGTFNNYPSTHPTQRHLRAVEGDE